MEQSSVTSISSKSVKSSKMSSKISMSSFSSSMESDDVGVSLGLGVEDLMKSKSLLSDEMERKMSLKSSGLVDELEKLSATSLGISKGLSMDSDLSELIGSDSAKSSSVSQVSQSSKKVSSSSMSSSSLIKASSKDGGEEIVAQETVAEKSVKASQSESVKRVEDGQVVEDSKQSSQSSARAAMRSNEIMSADQLDAFFNQPALQLSLQAKPAENLNFDTGSKTFEAKLEDLSEFSPDDLVVKIIDGVITIVGNHDEQTADGNYKTQHYIRKFTVPKGLRTNNVSWNLGSDGILAISAGESVKGGTSQYHIDCTLIRPKSFFKK